MKQTEALNMTLPSSYRKSRNNSPSVLYEVDAGMVNKSTIK